jgi:hypothetical protein
MIMDITLAHWIGLGLAATLVVLSEIIQPPTRKISQAEKDMPMFGKLTPAHERAQQMLKNAGNLVVMMMMDWVVAISPFGLFVNALKPFSNDILNITVHFLLLLGATRVIESLLNHSHKNKQDTQQNTTS